MLIVTSRRERLAGLLHALAAGEQLARDCARWQARAARCAGTRRLFSAQARHEGFHATLFTGFAHWLAPGSRYRPRHCRAIESYRRRLEKAMDGRRWCELLVGQQVVLEGLGEAVLGRLDGELERRGLGFERLRRTVLAQERAHQRAGLRLIAEELDGGRCDERLLRTLADGYAALADTVLDELAPQLEGVGANPDDYREAVRLQLPHWAIG